MRLLSVLALTASTSLFSCVVGSADVVGPSDLTTDICCDVNADLSLLGIIFGPINACICLSNIPWFLSSHSTVLAASAYAGSAQASSALTDLVHKGPGQTCHYPPHSIQLCQSGNPCGFTCTDGYTPYPYIYPSQCVCESPYSECNGKCGLFYGCPSPGGWYKRDNYGANKLCPQGHTACGIPARSAKAWECLNTQTELESCGGCVLPFNGQDGPKGVDCTAIAGISDVSCIKGRCSVHRCMPGYKINAFGDSCDYVEDNDSVVLAAQYGLEHIPL